MIGRFYPPNPAFRWALIKRGGRLIYELTEPTIYDDPIDGPYPIDAGKRSDGGTVPQLLWWFMPPVGPELLACWLHDDLLDNETIGWSRAKKDQKFREAMRSCGTPLWKRNAIWLAVRLYGLLKG